MRIQVSKPGGIHEREATDMSRQIIRKSPVTSASLLSAETAEAINIDGLSSLIAPVIRQPGSELDPAFRARAQMRFGQDFSHVRVHTDAEAGRSAAAVNARAYTL